MAQKSNTSTTKATKAVTIVELWLAIIRTAANPGSIVLDYATRNGARKVVER